MNSKQWKGEEVFEGALSGLLLGNNNSNNNNNNNNPQSAAIQFAVDIAFQHIDYYKFIVHDIEKWMKRQGTLCDRVWGIILINAICKESRRLHGTAQGYI